MSRWLLMGLFAAGWAAVRPSLVFDTVRVELDPPAPIQGRTLRLVVKGTPPWADSYALLDGRNVALYRLADGSRRGLIPIAGDAEGAKELDVRVGLPRPRRWKFSLAVAPGAFPSQTIKLDRRTQALFEDPEVAVAQVTLRRAYATRSVEQLWRGTFLLPLQGRRSGPYGARRVMQGVTRYFHKGMDLAAPTGSPIHAAAPGQVLVARRFPLQGNVVVVDHGHGVQTVYQHMDSILTQEGRFVGPADVVGTVGSTGISTGPHLHWTLMVDGVPVDPEEWTRREF